MDKISALSQRNPVVLASAVGHRLRDLRMTKGWTQDELAAKAGVAASTLKLLEAKGQGSFQRLVKVAVALGVDGELRDLFSRSASAASIESVKLAERKRAPRRKKEESDGS